MKMRQKLPLLVGFLLCGAGCKNDTTIVKGQPELVLSVDNVDFGEVILGYQSTIGFYATNDGMGELTVSDLGLSSDSSHDFHLLSDGIDTIDPGESAELMVRYVPAEVGQDFGSLILVSDDEELPEASVTLEAFGVEPLVDVAPSILWYGTVAQGESQTQSFQVSARGSGSLKITDIHFAAKEGEAFAYTLPDGVELPYEMASGLSLSVDVTFTAIDDRTWDGSLVLQTNDPTTPEASIQLLANSEDDPTQNESPIVEILDPDYMAYYLEGETVGVEAKVWDSEGQLETISGILYADGVPIAFCTASSDGQLLFETDALSPGDITLMVRATDAEGAMGEDSIEVRVWDTEEPLAYTLTGGPTLYDYWAVDDDVKIYVDGVLVFSDTNYTTDTHPPFEFEAGSGSTIQIVATDANYCMQQLSNLTIHFGTGYSQELLPDGFCRSACPSDACYDPDFLWTENEVFFDETYTIEIP